MLRWWHRADNSGLWRPELCWQFLFHFLRFFWLLRSCPILSLALSFPMGIDSRINLSVAFGYNPLTTGCG
jgi:hypothetical protein